MYNSHFPRSSFAHYFIVGFSLFLTGLSANAEDSIDTFLKSSCSISKTYIENKLAVIDAKTIPSNTNGYEYGVVEYYEGTDNVKQFAPFNKISSSGVYALIKNINKTFDLVYYNGRSGQGRFQSWFWVTEDLYLAVRDAKGNITKGNFIHDAIEYKEYGLSKNPISLVFEFDFPNIRDASGYRNPKYTVRENENDEWSEPKNLMPNTRYIVRSEIKGTDGEIYTGTGTEKTISYVPKLTLIDKTPFSINCEINATGKYGHFELSSAIIKETSKGKSIHGKCDKNYVMFDNLEPQKSYEFYSAGGIYVRNSDGKTSFFSLSYSQNPVIYETPSPSWTEGMSEALTTTKARISYKTNIGFSKDSYIEWRREDAPLNLQSQKSACPIVNGRLVGVLNNLKPDVYYKFRPIYTYNGTNYVGEWIGIFTGDAYVWFDPEVYTFDAISSDTNKSVILRGSVISGSGEISEQGFELWTDSGTRTYSTHKFIHCDGISFDTELKDLYPGTTYTFCTFAKVNDKYFRGKEISFTTKGESIIPEIDTDSQPIEVIGYYDIHGIKHNNLQKGFNIILYSNGSTKKIYIH